MSSSNPAEYMSHQELLTRTPIFHDKLHTLFPQLLMRSQTDPSMSVYMYLGMDRASHNQDETIPYFQSYPREEVSSRSIIVNAPCAPGRLRIEQTDSPNLTAPSYEATLFNPPTHSDPLDNLEREIGRLKHDRDGISLQLRTSYTHKLRDKPDIRILTFQPFRSASTREDARRTGQVIGTPITHPEDRLRNIYRDGILPRLDEVQEEVLANRGICGLLAFQIDQVLATVETVVNPAH